MFCANPFFEPAARRADPTARDVMDPHPRDRGIGVGQRRGAPHGYELRLVLNQRFLRSRVHESLSGVLADATDTRTRFELLGFCEVETSITH